MMLSNSGPAVLVAVQLKGRKLVACLHAERLTVHDDNDIPSCKDQLLRIWEPCHDPGELACRCMPHVI